MVTAAVEAPRTAEWESWQTGVIPGSGGIPRWSKRHIWDERGIRMLCAAINWAFGNVGGSDTGDCSRCPKIAKSKGWIVP